MANTKKPTGETGSGLGLRLSITLEKASKALLQKASEVKEVKISGGVLDIDCQDVIEVDYRNWDDWDERTWQAYEQKLALNDEFINEQFIEQWDNSLEYMDEYDFLSAACRRNPCWAVLISWEWAAAIDVNPGLLNHSAVQEKVVKWCDECDEADGYYIDDEFCFDDYEGIVNRWAYVLSAYPQLASRCTTYQKFNGYSRCMLIAKQPQFAEKFSLEELGDPNGAFWSTCDLEDGYTPAWNALVNAHPEFAKYRKG